MKRTSKSTDYKESIDKLKSLNQERSYRELWRHSYIRRYIYQTLYNKGRLEEVISETLTWSDAMVNKYYSGPEDPNDLGLVLGFINSLVYGYHRKTCSDGFIDLRYEDQLAKYDNPIDRLTQIELNSLKTLHDLTHRFGYLILELYAEPDSSVLWDEFIKLPPEPVFGCSIPPFYPYPTKNNSLKGIQISSPPYESNIQINWDMAIFYNDKDRLSHIQDKLSKFWELEGEQTIGDSSQYQVALYINREYCKKTYVLKALKLQVSLLDLRRTGLLALQPDDLEDLASVKPHTDPKKILPNVIDAFRLSEGLTEKHWKVDKNNIRRTIGIYLWDEINTPNTSNISRKSLIKATIERLRECNPAVLEHYHSNYNIPISPESSTVIGDQAEVQNSLVREMEADYDLTNFCIENADYFSPSHAKKARKQKVC